MSKTYKSKIKIAGTERFYQSHKAQLNQAYDEIQSSGNLVDSKYCKSVETKLKKITGRKHARLFTSGTSAIQVALLSWNMIDKQVACSNYSFIASANQAALLNNVEFFDVDKRGLMDIKQKFQHDLVIPVSLYGNMIDYDKIQIGPGTKVIVDSAQSLGSKYKGRNEGFFGDASVFSFASNKPIPTAGTHGALVWDDDGMSDKIKAVSINGKLHRNGPILTYGINAKPFELQACQIDIGLDYLDKWQLKREQIYEYYKKEFINLPLDIIDAPDYCKSNFPKFAMLSNRRDSLMNYLNDNHIEALMHYTDNFAHFFGSIKSFPGTDQIRSNIITIPNHQWLSDAEVEQVAKHVKMFFRGN